MRTLFILLLVLGSQPLLAAGPAPSPSPAPAPPPVEATPAVKEATVDEIREQYWARGRQSSLGVVQNRNHPRKNRLEIAALGGLWFGNPYLSIKSIGASVGFHFSEWISFHAAYQDLSTSPSSALQDLLNKGSGADTNEPRSTWQGEVRFNLAYGKLALTGTELVYLDANFALGAGRLLSETGGSLLLSAGVGQRFHLGKSFSVDLDYRVLTYRETIPGKTAGTLGTVSAPRTNVSHSLTLGLSVFFDFSTDSAPAAGN